MITQKIKKIAPEVSKGAADRAVSLNIAALILGLTPKKEVIERIRGDRAVIVTTDL